MDIVIDVVYVFNYFYNDCKFLIVYCDLKLSNILFDEDMVVYVGDFGLVKFFF